VFNIFLDSPVLSPLAFLLSEIVPARFAGNVLLGQKNTDGTMRLANWDNLLMNFAVIRIDRKNSPTLSAQYHTQSASKQLNTVFEFFKMAERSL
jgi:hypothetical protein